MRNYVYLVSACISNYFPLFSLQCDCISLQRYMFLVSEAHEKAIGDRRLAKISILILIYDYVKMTVSDASLQ